MEQTSVLLKCFVVRGMFCPGSQNCAKPLVMFQTLLSYLLISNKTYDMFSLFQSFLDLERHGKL